MSVIDPTRAGAGPAGGAVYGMLADAMNAIWQRSLSDAGSSTVGSDTGQGTGRMQGQADDLSSGTVGLADGNPYVRRADESMSEWTGRLTGESGRLSVLQDTDLDSAKAGRRQMNAAIAADPEFQRNRFADAQGLSPEAFFDPGRYGTPVSDRSIGLRSGLGESTQNRLENFTATNRNPALHMGANGGVYDFSKSPSHLLQNPSPLSSLYRLNAQVTNDVGEQIHQHGFSALPADVAGSVILGGVMGALANGGPRYMPGTATMSTPLPPLTGPWLRGTEGNAGLIPGQVAAKLEGRKFSNFGEFRSAFWKEVANTPELVSQFRRANIALMQKGYAPSPARAQLYGGNDTYVLHHRNPISNGGGVYDMSNIVVMTPLMHQSILDPGFHFGRNSQ